MHTNYSITFTLHGNIIEEHGIRPVFLLGYLEKLRQRTIEKQNINDQLNGQNGINSLLNDTSTIQGNLVQTSFINDQVHMTVGPERKIIQPPQTKEKNVKKKNRKWQGDENELDYSSSRTACDTILDEPEKESLLRRFKGTFFQSKLNQYGFKGTNHLVNLNEKLNKNQINQITKKLIDKNVSSEVVNYLMADIPTVNELRSRISQILKVKTINLEKKQTKIALVGPNGVGKSTTLSKLCLLLLNKNKSIYVAACDTFRAGAIEQLSIYINKLKKMNKNIQLHQEGYFKEETKVAKNAMKFSKNFDILLCDTAGRTNNKNLMDSLKKFCNLGFDDILYVNEALKGGSHDIFEWDFITGIIVTKIDTVDDKIGALLNYTYFSNKPLVYLCYGQSNMDIEEINVEHVIDTLLS